MLTQHSCPSGIVLNFQIASRIVILEQILMQQHNINKQ